MAATHVIVHDEVAEALAGGRPVVALETAVLTHGLPRDPLAAVDQPGWDTTSPANLETSRLLARSVRGAGAAPATIAVVDGRLRIGLDPAELETLAMNRAARKASTRDLAAAMASGASAGTTVAATMAACRLARPAPISVFATGGIGGVHRGATECPDVSADLEQLATTPVCVVCAGAKAILDIPATLEALETRGVPVVGFGTEAFPSFYSRGREAHAVSATCSSTADVAQLCAMHWGPLNQSAGVLVTNPLPNDIALDADEVDAIVERAVDAAERRGIRGAAVTPFLLTAVAEATGGRALQANIALLARNAQLAAEIAATMAG